MVSVLIALVLASNLFLFGIIFRREAVDKAAGPTEKEPATGEDAAKSDEGTKEHPQADIVGKSTLDIDEWRKIIREEFREVVPLIIKEYGTPADAGRAEEETSVPKKFDKVVKKENLDKVFSNTTASELTGEAPPEAEPMADGIDFDQMNTTMKVLKGKSDKPEDIETTKRVLAEAGDARIFEVIKLDPVIQKRILMIECQIPEISEYGAGASANSNNKPSPKKIVYHADINTEGLDAIDFNIYH